MLSVTIVSSYVWLMSMVSWLFFAGCVVDGVHYDVVIGSAVVDVVVVAYAMMELANTSGLNMVR